MVTLHLVRHGPPLQDPDIPAWEWSLAPGAAAAVAPLRDSGVLPEHAVWVTSPEPKARGTAGLLTDAAPRVEADLREAGRSAGYVDAAVFERQVLAAFADPLRAVAPGWEPLADAQARVVRVAQAAVAAADGGSVVLVGHGTSLTMLVAALSGAAPDGHAWQRLRMPDHCSIEWHGRILSPWGGWSTVRELEG